MKSIREWMLERGLVNEELDRNAMARYFGSTTVEVDQNLRRELKPKIERIMDMDEFRSMPKEEMLQKIKVVVSQVVAEVGGSTATARGLAGRIGDGEGSSVDKNKFARMMGSERLDVDQGLRRELKPKLERIMDMEEYRSMPKSELESKLIAVVSQLVAEMSGSSMSLGGLGKRIDSFSDDPVAQESRALPSFLRWIENSEEAVSEPQHEEGEENMDLKAVVEKRMMQMAMELESDGKGSRKDVLAAMKAVVDSASQDMEKAGAGEQAPPEGGQPPADGQQPQMQQAPPQMQPQVQS